MLPARDAVRSWYREESSYNNKQPRFSFSCAQFTQLVWKSTTHFGIAMATSCEGSVYIVANYSPAGNVRGQFKENVLPQVVTSFHGVMEQNGDDGDVCSDSDLE